jgi:hypothetical protein
LLEALRYKLEGRGFDSHMVSLEFFIDRSFQPHYGPGVDSASNRNEYQEHFLGGKGGWCLRLTPLPPSCGDCLEIWELLGPVQACTGIAYLFACFVLTNSPDTLVDTPLLTRLWVRRKWFNPL